MYSVIFIQKVLCCQTQFLRIITDLDIDRGIHIDIDVIRCRYGVTRLDINRNQTQIQFIQNMLLSAATGGLAILGAQYWGRGNIKTLDDIFCMALRLCGLVSIAFFIACICFSTVSDAVFYG